MVCFLSFWNMTVLQCCVHFCYTAKWIGYMYTYIPPSWASLLPLEVVKEPGAELPVLCSCSPLAVCVTHGSVYMSMLLSQSVSPFPSHGVYMSVLYVCVSIPALPIGSSVQVFWTPYIKSINSIFWIQEKKKAHVLHIFKMDVERADLWDFGECCPTFYWANLTKEWVETQWI